MAMRNLRLRDSVALYSGSYQLCLHIGLHAPHHDPVAYKKYTDRIPAIMKQYGGKVLARGGRYKIMEGPETFHRFVVIEFPTLEQGVACFESAEYQEAAAFRKRRRRRRARDRGGR